MTQVIGAYKARQNFGELLEMAYYQGKRFLIKRGRKSMAYLLGQPTMKALFELIDSDPALADTLAILSNPSARKIIEKGEKEIRTGQTVPLARLLQ